MSAFMVSDDHIDYLVSAVRWFSSGAPTHRVYYGNPTHDLDLFDLTDIELGQMFVGTNLTSMQARYPGSLEPGEMAAVEEYTHRRWVGPIEHAQVLKAITCYEYQSCEYAGWDQSPAHAVMQWLHGRVISRLPGYAEAAWEVHRGAVAAS